MVAYLDQHGHGVASVILIYEESLNLPRDSGFVHGPRIWVSWSLKLEQKSCLFPEGAD